MRVPAFFVTFNLGATYSLRKASPGHLLEVLNRKYETFYFCSPDYFYTDPHFLP